MASAPPGTFAAGESAKRRIARALFLASFLSYACFLQEPLDANVSSRMFLTLSLVKHGEVSIDRYAAHTIDKAEHEGRFYCDKAPGLSFLGIPAVAFVSRVLYGNAGIGDPGTSSQYYWAAYAATVTTAGLLTALSVAIVFLLALDLFGSAGGALVVALAYGMATPAFGWATAFVGHAPATALLVIGFHCLRRLRRGEPDGRRDVRLAAAGTACLAWAVVTEFTVAPLAAVLLVVYGARILAPGGDRARLVRCVLLTGAACAAPLLLYNQVAFGAPWHLGYQSVSGFPGMKQGFLGIGTPSLPVLGEILAGPRRGILLLCPLLLLVPFGLLRMLARKEQRGTAILIVVVGLYYLLLNASYFYWDGGWSTGPRHITGTMPFLCLALGAVWGPAGRGARGAVLALVGVSALLTVMATTAGMFASSEIQNLVRDHVLKGFLDGSSTAVPVHELGWRSRDFVRALVVAWVLALGVFLRLAAAGRRAAVVTP
ncbi:MAG TPA: hypothetical protein VFY93_17345 [Planctomycetota bacterium]|nr:hypothetical protein [Planctomycetota bacterium]